MRQKDTEQIKTDVQKRLFEMQDLGYRDFHSRLIPGVHPETIIGVRTPMLRKFAKEFSRQTEAETFLEALPHRYYEENNLHGFLIEQIKDFDTSIGLLDRFLPYMDNWATCDLVTPKIFKSHLPELLGFIRKWLVSGDTYTVRYGIRMLMWFYLESEFDAEYLELVAGVRSEEYYINMAVAWYFATALTKQYDAALPYVKEKRLSVWIHNKTIQKAVESYQISDERKAYLRKLKYKN